MATPKPYLKNADLLAEIIACRETGRISDKLARMLLLLVERYSLRPNFRAYSYRDEMVADALASLSAGILKFNPAKSSSAFGYATQIAKNAFLRRLQLEKRQRDIRDDLLIARGAQPSFTRQAELELQMAQERDVERR